MRTGRGVKTSIAGSSLKWRRRIVLGILEHRALDMKHPSLSAAAGPELGIVPMHLGAIRSFAAFVGALCWIAASPSRAADSNALWHVVHDLCVTDMKATGSPAPCAQVDLVSGYAVLKDIRGATQLLLIPTDRVTGIESPVLLAPASPNYWQAAWGARPIFEQRAGGPVPRGDIGLAINSIYGRSQNQLHIHIDCVRADVRDALQANASRIGFHWSDLDVDLAGRRYRAMRVDGADLGARDPFKLLAEGDPAARADMGAETLVVIAVDVEAGPPGFVLLSDRADPARGDQASGEDLLDHQCAALRQAGAAGGSK
jgi:CDP-diacylglycerol pyrophosphatase